jgi:hypothetical protein
LKRKLIALDLALVAAIGAASWKLRQDWVTLRAREHKLHQRSVRGSRPPALNVAPAPQPVAAVVYAEIAQQMLFSRDRNPDVVIEPEPAPKEKPMPPLPVLYGVMNLVDSTTVVMSETAVAPHHGVRLGEAIGPFKLVAVNREDITFEWEGKSVTKKIGDMLVREAPAGPTASNAGPRTQQAPQRPSQPPPPPKADPVPGADTGNGVRACQPGDSSPAGTVADGYRKLMSTTPFGSMCRGEPIQKPQ